MSVHGLGTSQQPLNGSVVQPAADKANTQQPQVEAICERQVKHLQNNQPNMISCDQPAILDPHAKVPDEDSFCFRLILSLFNAICKRPSRSPPTLSR